MACRGLSLPALLLAMGLAILQEVLCILPSLLTDMKILLLCGRTTLAETGTYMQKGFYFHRGLSLPALLLAMGSATSATERMLHSIPLLQQGPHAPTPMLHGRIIH